MCWGHPQCHAGLKGIKQTEDMDCFPLEMLTQLNLILLVHFACLEIELQLTYGGVQGVFLQQQTCSGRGTGVLFTTRPLAVHERSPNKSRGTQHNTHNKDQIEHQELSSGAETVPTGTGARRSPVRAAERSGHRAIMVPITMTSPPIHSHRTNSALRTIS